MHAAQIRHFSHFAGHFPLLIGHCHDQWPVICQPDAKSHALTNSNPRQMLLGRHLCCHYTINVVPFVHSGRQCPLFSQFLFPFGISLHVSFFPWYGEIRLFCLCFANRIFWWILVDIAPFLANLSSFWPPPPPFPSPAGGRIVHQKSKMSQWLIVFQSCPVPCGSTLKYPKKMQMGITSKSNGQNTFFAGIPWRPLWA